MEFHFYINDLARMSLVGIAAIIFWEGLDFISPRLKVGLLAGLMASQQPFLQSFGIICIFRVLWNGARNFVRSKIQRTNSEIEDSDGFAGA